MTLPTSPAVRPTHLALLAALLIFLSVAAAWLCPGGSCGTTALDQAGLAWMSQFRSPWADRLMTAVTWLGSLYVLLPTALALGAWQASRGDSGRRWQALFVPAALLGASAIVHALKLAVARPRPGLFEPLVTMPIDPSFPSAHTMQACAFAAACLLQRRQRAGAWGWAVVAVFVSVIGASRIYLQVHFPTDVLAGAAVALVWVVVLRRVWPPAQAAQ